MKRSKQSKRNNEKRFTNVVKMECASSSNMLVLVIFKNKKGKIDKMSTILSDDVICLFLSFAANSRTKYKSKK